MIPTGGWMQQSRPRGKAAPWRFKPFKNAIKAGLRFTTSLLGPRFFLAL
jgi:hypothetical protein